MHTHKIKYPSRDGYCTTAPAPTTQGKAIVQITPTSIARFAAIGITIFGAGYFTATWDPDVMHTLIATAFAISTLTAILPPMISSHVATVITKRDRAQEAQRLLDRQINRPTARPINGHRLHLVRDDDN